MRGAVATISVKRAIAVVCLRDKQKDLKEVLCLVIKKLCVIGVDKRVILLGAAHNQGRGPQIRETSFPWGGSPTPK